MATARRATPGFFPLDEELELLPGSLSPWLYENLARLGTWIPFARAAEMLAALTGVVVSEDVAQERAETAGAAQVALQTAEVERLEREAPPAPPGPDKQYLSADGAFVPLVGGAWAEVKSVVIGEVAAPVMEKGERVVHTQHLSYFSRLANADTFDRLALVETHRRGVENAGQVAAVLDGAEWLQGFTHWHRPDALRILDFPHAAGYVGQIGQATWGADSPELAGWLSAQLHQLKHAGPPAVLMTLQEMVAEHPQAQALELPQALAYLEKRTAQMDYPRFQALGWPIASGATESGNKLVVEARLKGAGMHWARTHVDPMLALRNVVCNNRWDEAWPQIAAQLRRQARDQRAARRQQRRAMAHAEPQAEVTPAPADPGGGSMTTAAIPVAAVSAPPPASEAPPPPRRPAANHPWRRSPACLPSRSRWPAD
jgi:hypothetical protein